jgi:hypothetical protein
MTEIEFGLECRGDGLAIARPSIAPWFGTKHSMPTIPFDDGRPVRLRSVAAQVCCCRRLVDASVGQAEEAELDPVWGTVEMSSPARIATAPETGSPWCSRDRSAPFSSRFAEAGLGALGRGISRRKPIFSGVLVDRRAP